MTKNQFLESLDADQPPSALSEEAKALWHAKKGDWNQAHKLVQDLGSPLASRIHGFLHIQEGDMGNARYWYGRAGRLFPTSSLDQEWEHLLEAVFHSWGQQGNAPTVK